MGYRDFEDASCDSNPYLIRIPKSPEKSDDENTVIDNRLATILCTPRPFYNDSSRNCYKVLSSDEIVRHVDIFVRKVDEIVKLNTTITRVLLSHCKWDKEAMVDKFFEDADKLYKEARVINPIEAIISAPESDKKECQICYAEMSPNSSTVSDCGHRFCTTCWAKYFKVKIMDEGVGNAIECAADDCDILIDDETVMQLVGDPIVRLRYQKLIANSFVQKNKLLRWCPGPGCSFAFNVSVDPSKPICCRCECGTEFCFECGEEYHAPITCELLEQFKTHLNLEAARNFLSDDADDVALGHFTANQQERPVVIDVGSRTSNVKVAPVRRKDLFPSLSEYFKKDLAFHAAEPSKEDTELINRFSEPARIAIIPNARYSNYKASARNYASAVEHFVRNRNTLLKCKEQWRNVMTDFELASLEWVRTCRTLKYFAVFDMYAVHVAESILLRDGVDHLTHVAAKLSESIQNVDLADESTYATIKTVLLPAFEACQLVRSSVLKFVDDGFDNERWMFAEKPR